MSTDNKLVPYIGLIEDSKQNETADNKHVDPLFQPEDRNTMFPIIYPTIWQSYKKQFACIWQVHEVDLTKDLADWNALQNDEQHFIKMVLAFFASSDLIVNSNLSKRFIQEMTRLEFQVAYGFQTTMEFVHSEMYAALIDMYVKEPLERHKLFNAIKTIPIIKKKAEWANYWISADRPFVERLVAFAAVEGIFFSGSFCAIFWLKERGILPGLCLSNDFISRDEGLHTEFATLVYDLLSNKISFEMIKTIFTQAVELEIEFITEALPCKLIGMNSTLMKEYIKCVANRLASQFGHANIFDNVQKQPFAFMDRIGLSGKSNFFELRPSQYNKGAVVEESDDAYADL